MIFSAASCGISMLNSSSNFITISTWSRLSDPKSSTKLAVDTTFDSCSYPGVKCKFYFCNKNGFDEDKQTGVILQEDNHLTVEELIDSKKYTKVSFMIFRTGGCLIVGNCSEEILTFVYDFVKKMLKDEYSHICMKTENLGIVEPKKTRKKH